MSISDDMFPSQPLLESVRSYLPADHRPGSSSKTLEVITSNRHFRLRRRGESEKIVLVRI